MKKRIENQPNILWICTDQQRYDTIHSLGNEHIRTPNIDQLVSEGIAFTHAFCQSPICTPSRASFLTGRYPSTVHGCMNGNEVWGEGAPLITKRLADAGYDCGLAGKFHLAGACGRLEPRPKEDGYRVFHWSHHSENDFTETNAYTKWLAGSGIDPDITLTRPEDIPPDRHQSFWCAEKAIEFMSENREDPWLMSVNFFDPHAPFNPPREFRRRYESRVLPPPLFRPSDLQSQARLEGVDFQNMAREPETFEAADKKAAYYAMIELIDDNVGRMLDVLERTGQREDTLVIFMSDHGEMLGDHGLILKGCRFYEGLVRVPLIMSWPGVIPNGLRSDALVELMDIAPTLLEINGLSVPSPMQGRSLWSLIRGECDRDRHREFVRCEYYHTLTASPLRERLKSASPKRESLASGESIIRGSFGTMIRDERHKLVVYHGHSVGELFDLENDPGEFDNLWDCPDSEEIRFDLTRRSFDALAFAVDRGPEQTLLY